MQGPRQDRYGPELPFRSCGGRVALLMASILQAIWENLDVAHEGESEFFPVVLQPLFPGGK